MHTPKVDTSKLKQLPVPSGFRMKYRHHYKENLIEGLDGESEHVGPKKFMGTTAWLEDKDGNTFAMGESRVNPKDTPIKKLGRIIAHNRCVKNFTK